MPASLPDAYVTIVSSGIAIQAATQRCIDHLTAACGPLINGTIAVVAPEAADLVFAGMDAAALHTITLG